MKTLTIHNPSFNYQLQEFKRDLEVKEYSKSYQTRKNAHAKEFLFFCEAGHKWISSTERYRHRDNDSERELINRWFPKGK